MRKGGERVNNLLRRALAKQSSCFSPTEKFSPSASTAIISWEESSVTLGRVTNLLLCSLYLFLQICPLEGSPHLLVSVRIKRINIVPGNQGWKTSRIIIASEFTWWCLGREPGPGESLRQQSEGPQVLSRLCLPKIIGAVDLMIQSHWFWITSSITIDPEWSSTILSNVEIKEDLPAPVLPTIPTWEVVGVGRWVAGWLGKGVTLVPPTICTLMSCRTRGRSGR